MVLILDKALDKIYTKYKNRTEASRDIRPGIFDLEVAMSSELGYDGGLTCSFEVSDMDASITWYSEMLGFQLLYRVEEMGWCELATAVKKVNIGLSVVEKPEVKGGTTLTFGVEDVEKARKVLEDKGIKFDGDTVHMEGMVKLATFYDPDGNKLMLYQDLSQAGSQ